MNKNSTLSEIIDKRRSYRFLQKFSITDYQLQLLMQAAQKAPSCFNNQPWNFVFITEDQVLESVLESLPDANSWAKDASLIIAVFSKVDSSCVLKDGREYFLYDSGIASGFIMLQAADLGLVAHPIAGYNQDKLKKVLNIPEPYTVICQIVIGKHAEARIKDMEPDQQEQELNRPTRKNFNEFIHYNQYKEKK